MASKQKPDDTDGESIDDLRDEYPSGWRLLTRNDSVGLMLDALMDALPGKEFTKTELAEQAGVSRQSVHTHLDLLLALGVVEPVEDTSPQRYCVNRESDVLRQLTQLEGVVNEQMTT